MNVNPEVTTEQPSTSKPILQPHPGFSGSKGGFGTGTVIIPPRDPNAPPDGCALPPFATAEDEKELIYDKGMNRERHEARQTT